MASVIDICNAGLSHLGARAQIASISPPDGSVEAGYCARFYPLVRKELLETFDWSFAKKRAVLAEVTNVSDVWTYAYAKPADCVKSLRVLNSAVAAGVLYMTDAQADMYFSQLTEQSGALFEVEGDVLYTHEPDAVLVYSRDVVDTTKFTPRFVIAAGMLMASYLAGPIIKGLDGAKVGAQWRQAAVNAASAATASDANAGQTMTEHLPDHMRVRA